MAQAPASDWARFRELATQHGMRPLTAPAPEPPELVRLGRQLFHDPILSGNRNIACATCHDPRFGTGDGRRLSIGEGGIGDGPERAEGTGRVLARNAPPLFNAGDAALTTLFWDGRVRFDPATRTFETPEPGLNGPTPALRTIAERLDSGLAAQALFPLTSPDEMMGQRGENEIADAPTRRDAWERLMARIARTPELDARMRDAYPELAAGAPADIGHVARALSAFIRQQFAATETPFDRALRGDSQALSAQALRGAVLFLGPLGCARCHSGPLLTDLALRSAAVPQIGRDEADDWGAFPHVVRDVKALYAFRTPPLRNVRDTGPYMHDGAYATLEEVVAHYRAPAEALDRFSLTEQVSDGAGTMLRVDRDAFRNELRKRVLSPPLSSPPRIGEAEARDLLELLREGLSSRPAQGDMP